MMDLSKRINLILEPSVFEMGYEIVQIRIYKNPGMQLQIMAERIDGSGMGVEDCATLSRAISAILDVEEPIKDKFTLEISSPGIDRPLTKPSDFRRFEGFETCIKTKLAIEGRKSFEGRLGRARDENVSIEVGKDTFVIPFEAISHAKLMLTDDLL